MASKSPSLVQLSNEIATASKTIQAYLDSHNGPGLTFDANGVERFPQAPEDIMEARTALIDATSALRDLALGPDAVLKSHYLIPHNLATLSWIKEFDIAAKVPLNGTISYEALAAAAGIQGVNRLRRMMRYAMLLRLFHEPEKDHVAHTASSRLLATNAGLRSVQDFQLECVLPASLKSVEAHKRFGDTTERSHSAWNVAMGVSDEPMYVWAEKNAPHLRNVFADVVQEAWNEPGRNMRYVLSSYDWQSLPDGAKVVDVGGNTGSVSIRLAETFPRLKFIVQDLPMVIEKGRKELPENLINNIEFMVHDFYEPQPVKDADVYLFHWVFLDHVNEKAAKILQQTIVSMKPGAKIVIRDGVLLDPGAGSPTDELVLRKADISGNLVLNAGQRDLQTWKDLFSMASPKLKLEQINRPGGCALTVLVLGLEG